MIVTHKERGARFPSDSKKRRQILFEQAGVSLEDEAALLRDAIERNKANLVAEKVEVCVTKSGEVITVPVPDNQTRQRAVESIYELIGAKQNVRQEVSHEGPGLTLVLPNYYSQEFLEKERHVVDITPQPDQLESPGYGGDGSPTCTLPIEGDGECLPLPFDEVVDPVPIETVPLEPGPPL